MNMGKFTSHGIQILYEDINEKILSEALNEILNNPKYMKNAKKSSLRFKDRPLTPHQSVVYWTEFAAKNKDDQYLRSVASDMNFIQLHLIDVYFVIFMIFALILVFLYKCLKFLFKSLKSSVTFVKDRRINKKNQ